MALWKPFRGNRTGLDSVEKHDGYVYFCVDDGSLFFDYTDADGNLQRKQINAKDAETIMGVSLDELKNEISIQDVVILAEAQAYADSLASNYATAEQGVKADTAVQTVNGITPDENGNVEMTTGGVTSWNDLTDKPFGEESRAPITYDGNKDGKETFAGSAYMVFVKVSDEYLPLQTLMGATVKFSSHEGSDTIAPEKLTKIVDGFPVQDTESYVLGTDSIGNAVMVLHSAETIGGTALTAGIYVFDATGSYISEIEFPTTLKTLDEKFLPEHSHLVSFNSLTDKPFGEEGLPPIEWDGNVEGHYTVPGPMDGMVFVKVTDAYVEKSDAIGATHYSIAGGVENNVIITEDALVSGAMLGFTDGKTWVNSNNWMMSVHSTETIDLGGTGVTCTFEKGFYFTLGMMDYDPRRLVFPYSVKTLDEKFLPIDTITQHVIANLPIYEGEVEDV